MRRPRKFFYTDLKLSMSNLLKYEITENPLDPFDMQWCIKILDDKYCNAVVKFNTFHLDTTNTQLTCDFQVLVFPDGFEKWSREDADNFNHEMVVVLVNIAENHLEDFAACPSKILIQNKSE